MEEQGRQQEKERMNDLSDADRASSSADTRSNQHSVETPPAAAPSLTKQVSNLSRSDVSPDDNDSEDSDSMRGTAAAMGMAAFAPESTTWRMALEQAEYVL